MKKYDDVHQYVINGWDKAVKPKNKFKDFPLPYDYVPPCIDDIFDKLFYWDTYFTNVGLIIAGKKHLAYGNTMDLIHALGVFGCVPNMCIKTGANWASQPPLLFMMINDYYGETGDKEFLEVGYNALIKEYEFWMTKRMSPIGLNRYFTNTTDFDRIVSLMTGEYARRINLDVSNWTDQQKYDFMIKTIGEGESGEDHTYRFDARCAMHAPICLNSILYGFENRMAEFSKILDKGEENLWLERAQKRLALIKKYNYDEETGVYFDYDYENGRRTGVFCGANYLPYFHGITTDKKAIDLINSHLILAHGMTSCQKAPNNGQNYQWGYPNSWAPHNLYASIANEKAGNHDMAREIGMKWIDTLANVFSEKGLLFEKYNAEMGTNDTIDEYGCPEMLGWTGGVYDYFYNKYVLNKKYPIRTLD